MFDGSRLDSQEMQMFFQHKLLEAGIQRQRAEVAARVLATGTPERLLSREEQQLAKDVCLEWLDRQPVTS